MKNGNFAETAREPYNSHVREWKRHGRKVVGYTCSYLPDEILHAAGILPYRIRGHWAGGMTIGDTYFGPFICSLPKCLLQLAGEGSFDFLDGAVITPGCDSMRRLDECWRKACGDGAGALPGFFFHFGVPHKYTGYSVKWFTDETTRFMEALEAHFGVSVTAESLSRSIALYNRSRRLLREFDALRISGRPPFTGAEALAVSLAGAAMPREVYIGLLERFIAEAAASGMDFGNRLRLLLVGSASDDAELVRLIEGDRAIVVADNLCFGAGSAAEEVDEADEPVPALAKRYLRQNRCPRMFGQYRPRLDMLLEKIRSAGVHGVVLQNIRFCDLHGSENGLFERDLERAGIPCLRLEREYGPLVETGRMKMRIDAFIERMERRSPS